MYKKIEDRQFKDRDPEVIAWQKDARGELDSPLLYSFPQPGSNIKKVRYFAVRDYEKVLFYNKGTLIGDISSGIYELSKDARIKGTQIVWIHIAKIQIPWGIPIRNGIPTKEGYEVGCHGNIEVRISDPETFYNTIVAGKKEWIVQDLKNWIMSLLHSSLRDIFKNYNLKQIKLEDRERVINLVKSKVAEEFSEYGLQLDSFNIIKIIVPENLQEVVDHDTDKALIVTQTKKDDLDDLISQKQNFQERINELNERINTLQDDLLDGQLSQEEFDNKKQQTHKFISELQEKINNINKDLDEL
jgi:membrane protease subunit (stomatin/prohibitin family)